jgi:hypothetical protein
MFGSSDLGEIICLLSFRKLILTVVCIHYCEESAVYYGKLLVVLWTTN